MLRRATSPMLRSRPTSPINVHSSRANFSSSSFTSASSSPPPPAVPPASARGGRRPWRRRALAHSRTKASRRAAPESAGTPRAPPHQRAAPAASPEEVACLPVEHRTSRAPPRCPPASSPLPPQQTDQHCVDGWRRAAAKLSCSCRHESWRRSLWRRALDVPPPAPSRAAITTTAAHQGSHPGANCK